GTPVASASTDGVGRRARLRRRGLPAGVPRLAPRPDVAPLGGGRGGRRLPRPQRRDRRRLRVEGPAHPGGARGQRRTRLGPQRRRLARDGRAPGVPRLRRRPPARLPGGAGGQHHRLRLRLRDRVRGALGDRRPARAALDEAPARTRSRAAGRRAAGDPRRRVRLEQGLPALLLRRRRPPLARGSALRGPAVDHARLRARHLRRGAGDRLPLAHPRRRLLHHPAAFVAGRPGRSLDHQAHVVRRGALGGRRGRGGGVPRPGAGRRPVALLPGDPGRERRVVGTAPRRGPRVLGRSALVDRLGASARAPSVRLAGRAGPARRRGVADDLGADAGGPGAPGRRRAPAPRRTVPRPRPGRRGPGRDCDPGPRARL
ncbi:MAG: Glycosyltransferase, partial [uncultured Nocardioides sp.]